MAENIGFEVKVGMDVSEVEAELQKSKNLLSQFQAQLKKSTNTIEINMLNNEIKTLNSTIGNLESQMSRAGKPIGDATQSLVNFGRIAQDAPFGIMGISNNLNPMLESFQRLSATEGGTKKALLAMVDGLMGPAGVGVALSAVTALSVVFSKEISNFFATPTEKLKEFRGELNKLNADIYSIVGGAQANRAVAMGYSSIAGSDKESLENRKTALKYLKDIYKDNKEIQDLTIESSTQYMNFAINRASKQEEYQGKEKNNTEALKKIYAEVGKLEDERNAKISQLEKGVGLGFFPAGENAYQKQIDKLKAQTNATYDALIKEAEKNLPSALKVGLQFQSALAGFETPDEKQPKAKKIAKEFDYVTAIKKRSILAGGETEAVAEDTTIKDIEKRHQEHLNWLSEWYKRKSKIVEKDYKTHQDFVKAQKKDYEDFAMSISQNVVGALNGMYQAMQNGDSFGKAFSDMLSNIVQQLIMVAAEAAIFSLIMQSLGMPVGGAGGGFLTTFASLLGVPKHAEGGITTGPSIGMIGEAGPEAIMPLSKLGNFLNTSFNAGAMSGGNSSNGGTFTLRGQDLLLSVNRAQKASNLKGQNISLA